MSGTDTYVVVCARADSRGWGQPWTHKYLQGPWLLACSPVAIRSHRGCMVVEAGDGVQAEGVQMHSVRG